MAPTLSSHSKKSERRAPLPVPQLHAVRRIRRAFLSICRCGDTLFSPYGVTTDQYALIRAVQREPGIRQTDLGDVIFAEPNTVTAMVTLLEKRGILRRRPSPTDRRAKLVYLTTRGEMVMLRLTNDWLPMRQILTECFQRQAVRRPWRFSTRFTKGCGLRGMDEWRRHPQAPNQSMVFGLRRRRSFPI